MENQVEKIRNWYRELPDKKKYLEFVSALLSVPVLVTVIMLNVNNLAQKNNAKPAAEPTPAITRIVETLQPVNIMQKEAANTSSSSSTASASADTPTPAQCKKQVGPINIISPQENEVITGNSVCITIDYRQDGYCDVVWSYSLDSASWSDYSNANICLYNITPGTHILNVRVKSTASDNQILLRRTFLYGTPTPTSAPTQIPTPTVPAPTTEPVAP